MKKLYKSLTSLILVITMLLSFVIVIFATESETTDDLVYTNVEAKYLKYTLQEYVNSGAESVVFYSQRCLLSTGETGYCHIGYSKEASSFYIQCFSEGNTQYFWCYKFDLSYQWKYRVAYESDVDTWEYVDNFSIQFLGHGLLYGEILDIDDLDDRCRLLFTEIREKKDPYVSRDNVNIEETRTSYITNNDPSEILYEGLIELSSGEVCFAKIGWDATVACFYIQPLNNNPMYKWAYKFTKYNGVSQWQYRDVSSSKDFEEIDIFSIRFVDPTNYQYLDCPDNLSFMFDEVGATEIIEEGVYWFSSMAAYGPNGRPRLIDVENCSADINTEVQQWDSPDPSDDAYRAQLFKVERTEDGYYYIYTFANLNYCLNYDVENKKICTGEKSIFSKWQIDGNRYSGFRITNYLGNEFAISVPESNLNGIALTLQSKNANIEKRNKWHINKFEGYIFSIVSEPGETFVTANEDSLYTEELDLDKADVLEDASLQAGEISTASFLDVGHSFLMFENCSSNPVVLGYITVYPGQAVTFGTTGNKSTAPLIISHSGLYYNSEAYGCHEHSLYTNRVSLSIPITNNELQIINNQYLLDESYNYWDLEEKNCSWFATQVWNSVSYHQVSCYSANGYIGIYHNLPVTLKNSISTYPWSVAGVSMPETNWYGYYKDGYFHYEIGISGANPVVPVAK